MQIVGHSKKRNIAYFPCNTLLFSHHKLIKKHGLISKHTGPFLANVYLVLDQSTIRNIKLLLASWSGYLLLEIQSCIQ